jgi:hypothetical protein
LDLEEKKFLFVKLVHENKKNNKTLFDDDWNRMTLLCEILADEMVNEEEVEDQIELFHQKFFRKKAGDVPVSNFLELYYLHLKNEKGFHKKLKQCYQKFPDYILFQSFHLSEQLKKKHKPDLKKFEELLIHNKNVITKFEADCYFCTYTDLLFTDENLNLATLLAFEDFIEDLDFMSDLSLLTITMIIMVEKTDKLLALIGPT